MQINRYSGVGLRSMPLPRAVAKQDKVDGTPLSDRKPASGKMDQLEHSTPTNQAAETQAPEKIKNTSSLPDHLFEYAQKQAAEDARNGVYMSKKICRFNSIIYAKKHYRKYFSGFLFFYAHF